MFCINTHLSYYLLKWVLFFTRKIILVELSLCTNNLWLIISFCRVWLSPSGNHKYLMIPGLTQWNLHFFFPSSVEILDKAQEFRDEGWAEEEGMLLWMVSLPQLYYNWHYTIFTLPLQVPCDNARFHFSVLQIHIFFFFFFSDCRMFVK